MDHVADNADDSAAFLPHRNLVSLYLTQVIVNKMKRLSSLC
jgi:hypothetical protein